MGEVRRDAADVMIVLHQVTTFADSGIRAADRLSLDILRGDPVVFAGLSRCGKTTTRTIAEGTEPGAASVT